MLCFLRLFFNQSSFDVWALFQLDVVKNQIKITLYILAYVQNDTTVWLSLPPWATTPPTFSGNGGSVLSRKSIGEILAHFSIQQFFHLVTFVGFPTFLCVFVWTAIFRSFHNTSIGLHSCLAMLKHFLCFKHGRPYIFRAIVLLQCQCFMCQFPDWQLYIVLYTFSV